MKCLQVTRILDIRAQQLQVRLIDTLSVLSINNTLTPEQLTEYRKDELIELIGNYQRYVKDIENKKKAKTGLETIFKFTSPKIDVLKRSFNYEMNLPREINDQKTYFRQHTSDKRFKVPTETEKDVIRYKEVVNVLLDDAVENQRTDLISEVQRILNNDAAKLF